MNCDGFYTFCIEAVTIVFLVTNALLFCQNFFKDPWNTFDFVTVIGSIVDAMVVEFGVSIQRENVQGCLQSKII